MPDREKILKALKCCAGTDKGKTCIYKATANDCPYEDLCREEDAYYECTKALAVDVLELLKEQEPVLFKVTRQDKSYPFWDSVCTGCGYKTMTVKNYWKYCPVCGRKVKWGE